MLHGGLRHHADALTCVLSEEMERGHLIKPVLLVALLEATSSCTHAAGAVGTIPEETQTASMTVQAMPPGPQIPILPVPQTQQQARSALEIAFAAEGVEDFELAVAQFEAVLGSDFLTDTGRMDVYWQTASAYRRLGDPKGEEAALEGFWLSAQLIPHSRQERVRIEVAEELLKGLKNGQPVYADIVAGDRLVRR